MKRKNAGRFGLKTVEPSMLMDISDLNMDARYQRAMDPQRTRKLVKSMEENGIWPRHITVNEDFTIIDGQHYVSALEEVGETQVYVTVVKCRSKSAEADFFSEYNSWTTDLSPADHWHAKKCAGDELGCALYKMAADPQSRLFENVKNLRDVRASRDALTINTALIFIVNALNSGDVYKKGDHQRYLRAAQAISYEDLRQRVNKLINFIAGSFGDKHGSPLAWTSKSLRSAFILYRRLLASGRVDHTSGFEQATRKMRSFVWRQEYKGYDQAELTDLLVRHFNKNLKTNKLVVHPDDQDTLAAA